MAVGQIPPKAPVEDDAYGAGWDGDTTHAPSQNAVYDKIEALGFVDRGDPADYDFAVGDFITDNTWRDLDLSSVVPAGAKAVLFRIQIKDNVTSSQMEFREKGNSNTINATKLRTVVANLYHDVDWIVACDSNRKIQYRGSNLAFVAIDVIIKGWWK
ncbi:hypothetical protein ES703_54496 [subsurface metagenome]